MFLLNIHVTKTKIIAFIALLGFIIIIFLSLTNLIILRSAPNINSKFQVEEDDESLRAFIRLYGIELTDKSPEISEVNIPAEFDNIYEDYEKLQNEMGLSLEEFKGNKVRKYTYEMANHSESFTTPVFVNILYYKGYVIAGDVLAPNIRNGFIRSLADYD